MYLLMRFAELVLPFFPKVMHDPIANGLAIIFYLVRFNKRKIIMENLRHIYFDRPIKNWMLKRMVWSTYRNFALSFLDIVKIPHFTERDLSDIFTDKASVNLAKALALGRGAILISLHLGNWDLGCVLLGHLGFPLVAVTERLKDNYLRFFKRRRERTGVETVVTDEILKIGRALKANKVIILVADRDITGGGKVVRFFDSRRRIPLGPIRLASRFQVPVVLGYLIFQNSGRRYLGYTAPHFFFGDDLDENLEKIVSSFEGAIRKFPDQWFVFEDEWID
ncbi:MAG TPA: hypothetical protein EYP58_01580 [bacterium (Candidatus Stahlbacteria)]|nr:hypothetical protein [Candidatus Stahlbacteria bacterium]